MAPPKNKDLNGAISEMIAQAVKDAMEVATGDMEMMRRTAMQVSGLKKHIAHVDSEMERIIKVVELRQETIEKQTQAALVKVNAAKTDYATCARMLDEVMSRVHTLSFDVTAMKGTKK
jgi:hypothetical protein